MKKLGIIGLGAIGYPIAKRFLAEGYELYTTVHSERSKQRAEDLGIHILETPKFFCDHVDIIILLVSNYEQCRQCLYAEDGIFTTMNKGTIILSSTVAPHQARELSELCSNEIHFLDAPVSGGVSGAEKGTLVCMTAGKYEAYEMAKKILSVYCKKIVYAGEEVGKAQKIKAINQMLVGVNIVATAEAANLAKASGLDLNAVFQTISECAGNSFIFQNRMPKLLKNDFSVRASLETLEKDTAICMELAKEVDAPCFMTSLCHELYQKTPRSAIETEDACAVIRMYETN